LNPLLPTLTPTNGNLDTPNSVGQNYSTIAVATGKWYVETTVGPITAGTACGLGLHFNPTAESGGGFYDSGAYIALLYENNLSRYEGANSNVNFYPTAGAGSILAIKIDLDSGTQTISYYVNNVLITSSNLPAGKTWFITTRQNNNQSLNFGQRAFAYTAPSGFKALCTQNLPAPLVTKSNTLMDVALFAGNGGTNTISGLQFAPDFVWVKSRSNAYGHNLHDIIRGNSSYLVSSTTAAEVTAYPNICVFNSDGFTLSADSSANVNGTTSVGWAWDAGTSTVTNNSGSISSQVRANPTAGFSVITYTGNGTAGATIGHGLGVAPAFFVVKSRSRAGTRWYAYHKYISATPQNDFIDLSSTDAKGTATTVWNNTSPTSSVITFGTDTSTNDNTSTFVCYAWTPVVGYSSFGSYVGNGSSDGVFVYTGHKSRWLMIKKSSNAGSWIIWDSVRDTYNYFQYKLAANLSSSENDPATIGYAYQETLDSCSNGFKLRSTNQFTNTSGETYIFASFAEAPFNYARAR
jgi:hypothetical protein